MRWAVVIICVVGCASRVVPVALEPLVGPVLPEAAARAWVLRAYRAEAVGDLEEAARAWRWARRYDDGAATAHGRFLLGQGAVDAAEQAFADGLVWDPTSVEAQIGMAAVKRARDEDPTPWLTPLLEDHPCRVVGAGSSIEREAVRRCRAR